MPKFLLIAGLTVMATTALAVTAAKAPPPPAAPLTPTQPLSNGRPPVIVEVFTSTNCPNCPASEAKLNDLAAGHTDFMVITEHVDYWNTPDMGDRPDPYSSQDYTQRQYDFSNRISERAGAVFTPMPVLDGQWVAGAPLFFTWSGKLDKALKAPPKAALQITRAPKTGAVTVSWPTGLTGTYDLVLLGVVKDEHHPNLWRATKINTLDAKQTPNLVGHQEVGAGDLPKGDHVLFLLQEKNGGPLRGEGLL